MVAVVASTSVVGWMVGVGELGVGEGFILPTIELDFQNSVGLTGSIEAQGFLLPDSLILSSKLSPNQISVDILGVEFLAVKAICWRSLWSFWSDFGMYRDNFGSSGLEPDRLCAYLRMVATSSSESNSA